ncbi:hypothetical protein LSTR_LSTR004790 [Laodelphax striatellus]|uniref:Uncharacterized protein n=1 Tax=Laodelphax striatellus TaxID=195883 RepID=A0A482XK89_LAOST|nr:hypothetical protein LSTR_LSTR004790 [Laodelphax striatellus]
MPSVSNHDTPCGSGQMNFPGMRNDYELLVNSMKPETNQSKHSIHAEQFSASGSNISGNFVPNFHGSSNGYYGYHMITTADTSNIGADCKDECFMDTNDDFGNQGMASHLSTDRLIEDARRKRPLITFSETLPKRSRQECITDGFHQEVPPPPPPHQESRNISSFHGVRRSAVLRRPIKSKTGEIPLSRETSIGNRAGEVLNMKKGFVGSNLKNLELVEILLKETHGCDLYNYRVCDL